MSDDEKFSKNETTNVCEMELQSDPLKGFKEGTRKLTSTIWNNFTAVDRQRRVASCDLCGAMLSYRSTVSNMRKHLMRKHGGKKDSTFRPSTFKVILF